MPAVSYQPSAFSKRVRTCVFHFRGSSQMKAVTCVLPSRTLPSRRDEGLGCLRGFCDQLPVVNLLYFQ